MSSNGSNNDLNREYIYVRRLISVLTNDDSDRLIVEKLKGKNLSSLLYNAKIIDNSKNMAANKKILSCVIRAIEREKHLCRKRELEQSWGRKFLSSFNCLYPSMKTDEEQSAISRGCLNERKSMHKMKHRAMSRRTRTSSTRTQKTLCKSSYKNGFKNRGNSSVRCAAESAKHSFDNKPYGYTESFRNYSCIESIVTDKEDDLFSESWKRKITQQDLVRCTFKYQKSVYETIRPPLLRQKKLNCVMVHPGRPLPAIKRAGKAEKKSSSTQTSDSSFEPDLPLPKALNNIKLQDLLEAASNLINTRDQREYVRSFLSNFEPPFDLSAGFPPYLKLPMKKSEDMVGKESIYGSNSELSLKVDRSSPVRQPLTAKDVIQQKEDNVRKYVRDLVSDPWQDTAESIISGVINESLPHDKADYSQLGACILKRLGAHPGSSYRENRYCKQNLNIPEIILQCTEFFESDAGDSDKNPEPRKGEGGPELAPKLDESPSIVEMKLLNDLEGKKPWDGSKTQNYCFPDGGSSDQNVGLLNLSESSLVDLGIHEDQTDVTAQGDGSQDRRNLQLREPLKITPSGLEQGGKKPKKAGIVDQRCGNKQTAADAQRDPATANIPELIIENTEITKPVKPARQKVSIFTVTSDKPPEPMVKPDDANDESATIESISIMKPHSASLSPIRQERKTHDHSSANPDDRTARAPHEENHTETIANDTPPEPGNTPKWEPVVAEVETFDGVGEAQSKLTELPTIRPDKKHLTNKNRTFPEKIRGKQKGKTVSKKRAHADKNDDSRNCKVM